MAVPDFPWRHVNGSGRRVDVDLDRLELAWQIHANSVAVVERSVLAVWGDGEE